MLGIIDFLKLAQDPQYIGLWSFLGLILLVVIPSLISGVKYRRFRSSIIKPKTMDIDTLQSVYDTVSVTFQDFTNKIDGKHTVNISTAATIADMLSKLGKEIILIKDSNSFILDENYYKQRKILQKLCGMRDNALSHNDKQGAKLVIEEIQKFQPIPKDPFTEKLPFDFHPDKMTDPITMSFYFLYFIKHWKFLLLHKDSHSSTLYDNLLENKVEDIQDCFWDIVQFFEFVILNKFDFYIIPIEDHNILYRHINEAQDDWHYSFLYYKYFVNVNKAYEIDKEKGNEWECRYKSLGSMSDGVTIGGTEYVSGHYRSGHWRNGSWVSGHWVRGHSRHR